MTAPVETGPVVGVDCSSERCTLALVRDGRCETEVERVCPGEQLRLLLPLVKEMLATAGLTPWDVRRMAVTVGPGSFTGLRLGISMVRTFTQITGCLAVPVGTLEACAWGMQRWWEDQGALGAGGRLPVVCPVLDARKGQVFAAAWRVIGTGNALQALWEPRALEPAAAVTWLSELRRDCPGEPLLVGGSGIRAYPTLVEGAEGVTVVPEEAARVHGRDVALVGAGVRGEVSLVSHGDLVPVYLRAPDVQVPRRMQGL